MNPFFEKREEIERNLLAKERTQLAAERTFLSWIRTGLTGIGIGIALARLINFQQIEHQKMGNMIGQFLILWGIFIFGFALFSYYRARSKIHVAPFWGPFSILTLVTIFLIILSLALLRIVVE